MELSIECVPTSYKSEEYKSSYWDFMMSQVKILPSRPFMANISLENISLQAQKTQKGVTGDFRKRAASPASQRVSMPELSSDYITYTGSLNNQNVNDKLGYSEGLNQCYSGSTKYMSKLNYSDKPFATTAQRTQDSTVYRTTNAEIDFGARTEKVQIKDSCVQRKQYITPVTSDTVKCHQLPKRCFATYINNEKYDNNTPVWYCTENKKMEVAFPSVQNNKNRLRTRGEDQLTQGLSEEAKNNLEHFIFMTHPHSRAPTSEHATFSKGKENNPSSLVSLIIRVEAEKDCDVLPDCFQDSEADMKFSNSHVDLRGKKKSALKQSQEKFALSMTAKFTGSSIENEGEDIESVSDTDTELTTEHKKILSEVLTLQEALELYKPDFIFRSQKRLQDLEVQARQRRVQIQECMQPQRKRIRPLASPFKKRQCTRPHPLSDNLYKPKERMIPEKEMQMRSKRIYNKLPEVKKKKEEEKKRVASQTNRLRAMVFKKKLLDQILQKQ
ncbi:(E2-independent) E3 ubiquitin-conjugating enzyme FATS isoform X2 [Hypanus sabinus]|uniref:(E2-independent) E3 ubiquitin-conjugating enzyme FATS isoform X2 n=1 Tax=Hypanus sabinus TaxID=79690 RepID=UPI0028C487C9|nr:(E2-independent) E3 ubiquitin-conjugating enzyme FATS isoform X2 [Hypanus sabinus]